MNDEIEKMIVARESQRQSGTTHGSNVGSAEELETDSPTLTDTDRGTHRHNPGYIHTQPRTHTNTTQDTYIHNPGPLSTQPWPPT